MAELSAELSLSSDWHTWLPSPETVLYWGAIISLGYGVFYVSSLISQRVGGEDDGMDDEMDDITNDATEDAAHDATNDATDSPTNNAHDAEEDGSTHAE